MMILLIVAPVAMAYTQPSRRRMPSRMPLTTDSNDLW